MSVLGQPLPHDSAREHVTGEAVYLDDMPPTRNELLVDFVGSPVAHGRIKSLDVTQAAALDGIVGGLHPCGRPRRNHLRPGLSR